MKRITSLSLALIMFSLFSISYLVTLAFAQEGASGAPTMGDPCMVVPAGPDRDACYATTPPPTGMALTGTPGMPPTGMAPTGTPESGGISSWIKGGLKALGIGSEPEMGDISHCAEFSGPPKAACEAAAGAPAPVVGDISHCAEFSGPPKVACEAAAAGN